MATKKEIAFQLKIVTDMIEKEESEGNKGGSNYLAYLRGKRDTLIELQKVKS